MKSLNKSLLVSLMSIIFIVALFAGNSPDNSRVENFKLKDYNGKEHQLTDFKNSKAIVIMFIATQCPVSNAYNERMAQIHKDFKNKGIFFIGINSNKQEDVGEIKEHAEENDFGFIILKDEKNIVADKFNASVTPEVYVLNQNLEVLYHGRIDDSRDVGKVKNHDLRNVLDEILSGKKITTTQTKAFGCTIKRVG
ncbi:MAG: thioredoxin family protein [Ignavibacteriales bacterium]|nr:thioredoxin family protein [Ignavibacteriales bacterium]